MLSSFFATARCGATQCQESDISEAYLIMVPLKFSSLITLNGHPQISAWALTVARGPNASQNRLLRDLELVRDASEDGRRRQWPYHSISERPFSVVDHYYIDRAALTLEFQPHLLQSTE